MAGNPTPREIVKGLLQGVAPPRPLFLPIVFSHAARVENMPLRSFLTNPTKISNSLRQIRAHLRSDGITCYFDPFLEAEALGATLQWDAEDRPPSLHWPEHMKRGGLPESTGLPSASSSRVAVAIDVIRRLKAIVRDDCLLTAGVTGPFTLAALFMQVDPKDSRSLAEIPASALDLAAATILGIATAFVEAGANVLFIREDLLPTLSPEDFDDWSSRLATTINVSRFYQALPVLLLTCRDAIASNHQAIVQQPWDCVVCPMLEGIAQHRAPFSAIEPARLGIALPPATFDPGLSPADDFDESLRQIVSDLRPAILTTAGDVPAAADMERLNKLWENVRRS